MQQEAPRGLTAINDIRFSSGRRHLRLHSGAIAFYYIRPAYTRRGGEHVPWNCVFFPLIRDGRTVAYLRIEPGSDGNSSNVHAFAVRSDGGPGALIMIVPIVDNSAAVLTSYSWAVREVLSAQDMNPSDFIDPHSKAMPLEAY